MAGEGPQRATERRLPKRPRFASPPIIELVLSVGFQPLPINVVQLGDIWKTFRDRFPKVEQKPPYNMPMEVFGQQPARPSVSLELVESSPLPRLWFVDAAGAQLIQVQNDWFARNWRRVDGTDGYPQYPALSDAFVDDLMRFRAHVRDHGLSIVPTQCEVTYIDHIDLPEEGGLGSVLSVLSARAEDFGLRPEGQALATDYLLEQDAAPVGRLHVTANTALRHADGKSIVVLNITARGVPLGESLDGVVAFQDWGREWAWTAFTSIIREEVQQSWR